MIHRSLPNRGAASVPQHAPVGKHIHVPRTPRNDSRVICFASEPTKSGTDDEEDDFEGLSPEDDWVVPGNNLGSLSQNTELGRAVDGACDELEHLAGLETGVLQEADDILKKFGFKSSILTNSATEAESPSKEADETN